MEVVMAATPMSLASWTLRSASALTTPRSTSRSVDSVGVTSIAHIMPTSRARPLAKAQKQSGEPGVPDSPLEVLSGPPFSWRRNRTEVWSRLFGRHHLVRDHRHIGAVVALGDEFHGAVDRGEEGMVTTHAHVLAGPELGAALTNEDVAGEHLLAAELLDAETAAGGVAPVARGAARFLVSHCALLDLVRL